jgi:geranylgeranyl pyrophosphate synthase
MTLMTAAPRPATAKRWFEAVRQDLTAIEEKMLLKARTQESTLDTAIEAIIRSGGKRMRPTITVLAGRAFRALWEDINAVAASIELLHTATLVHDDLVDGADERRGVATLHSRLPLGITVLSGDLLFAQSAALAAEANNVRIVRLFADTLVKICRGEILQAQTRWQIPSLDIYQERIYGKTASLFEASAASGAILGESTESEIQAMTQFGRDLGLAFQIMDDALDFEATAAVLGKPAGHDMRQGIFNLPVMYYVDEGYIAEGELRERLTNGDNHIDELVADMRGRGMIEKSIEQARQHIHLAHESLDLLPDNLYTHYLREVADYALYRSN